MSRVRTASTVQPGEYLEFYGIPVASTRVLEHGRYAGMVYITYARPYDDSRNNWRVYPADYVARFVGIEEVSA